VQPGTHPRSRSAASPSAWPPPTTITSNPDMLAAYIRHGSMSSPASIVPRGTAISQCRPTEKRVEHVFHARTARNSVQGMSRLRRASDWMIISPDASASTGDRGTRRLPLYGEHWSPLPRQRSSSRLLRISSPVKSAMPAPVFADR
jgi:hypothetical protein